MVAASEEGKKNSPAINRKADARAETTGPRTYSETATFFAGG